MNILYIEHITCTILFTLRKYNSEFNINIKIILYSKLLNSNK